MLSKSREMVIQKKLNLKFIKLIGILLLFCWSAESIKAQENTGSKSEKSKPLL